MQAVETRIPYRVPLVGGFTDFPEYYQRHEGHTISFTIDKFVSVSVRKDSLSGISIKSEADLPWGIGLGSGGAFHAALISALCEFNGREVSKYAVADLAYRLESGMENHSTGRQDSLACLFQGFSRITYLRDDTVRVERVKSADAWKKQLQTRLLLFETGESRRASASIKDIFAKDQEKTLSEIAKLPQALLRAWDEEDLDFLGPALDQQEHYRSQLSCTCRKPSTDKLLQVARECGAGARLTGAAVGCLLCFCPEGRQQELRDRLGIPEIPFSILW